MTNDTFMYHLNYTATSRLHSVEQLLVYLLQKLENYVSPISPPPPQSFFFRNRPTLETLAEISSFGSTGDCQAFGDTF